MEQHKMLVFSTQSISLTCPVFLPRYHFFVGSYLEEASTKYEVKKEFRSVLRYFYLPTINIE